MCLAGDAKPPTSQAMPSPPLPGGGRAGLLRGSRAPPRGRTSLLQRGRLRGNGAAGGRAQRGGGCAVPRRPGRARGGQSRRQAEPSRWGRARSGRSREKEPGGRRCARQSRPRPARGRQSTALPGGSGRRSPRSALKQPEAPRQGHPTAPQKTKW